jgi:AcrR family transcriptional regulator
MGTIYRYFSSKDELLAASLVTWIKILRNRLSERAPRGDTPAERLADTLTAATKVSDRAMPLMKALITAMSSTDPAVAPHRAEVNRLMAEIITKGMCDVPEGVDVDGVRRVVGHVWSSSINQWVSGMTPNGSVGEELRNAAMLLLGQYDDADGTSSAERAAALSAARAAAAD